jgi:hypothetical protein
MSELSTDPSDEPHTHNDSESDREHVASTPVSSTVTSGGTRVDKRRIPKKTEVSERTNDKEAKTTKSTMTPTVYVSDKPCNPNQPATLWGQPSKKFGYHSVLAYIHHTPLTSNNLKGTRVMWTEWITPNTYNKRVKSLSKRPEDTNVYLCTTMSIKSTDPSGYCPPRAGVDKAILKVLQTLELRRLKQEIDPRVTITLHIISHSDEQAAKLQGICFGVMRKPQDTSGAAATKKETIFNEYKAIGTDDSGRERSFTSKDTFLLDKPIKLQRVVGSGTHWEAARADMTTVINTIQHRRPDLSDVGVRLNPSFAVDKAFKAGKDLITAVGLRWANIPPLETIMAVMDEALRTHGPDFNTADDVQSMLRALHHDGKDATLPKWARRPEFHYTFLLYVWTLRPTDAELKHLVVHIEASRRSQMTINKHLYTQSMLANDLRAYVGKMDPRTDFNWPKLAQLSTMNPKAVSDWNPDAVNNLSKKLRELHEAAKSHQKQSKSFKLTERDRLNLLQKIYAIKGLGGTYLSEHLIAAFLHIFRIGYTDKSFLIMGSGSGAPKYAFFHFHGITDTDDLIKALHAFNKQDPIDKKWVTPRMVAFTLCVAGIFNDFLSGKSDVITV